MALYTKQITCTAHKKLWLILKNVENAVVEVYIAIHLFYITEPLKKVYEKKNLAIIDDDYFN